MAIRARVGRHLRAGGRQCQNWADDQKTVIDLLNRIPVKRGGAEGRLDSPTVAGICSDDLYSHILYFEALNSSVSAQGFVEPGGALLRRMESVAGEPARIEPARATLQPPQNLIKLRNNVLDDSSVVGKWTAGERVHFDNNLVRMATQHIDNLIRQGLTDLPWEAEIFGRAYVTKYNPMAQITDIGKDHFSDLKSPRLGFKLIPIPAKRTTRIFWATLMRCHPNSRTCGMDIR